MSVQEHKRTVPFPTGQCPKCHEIYSKGTHQLKQIENTLWVLCAYCAAPICHLPSSKYYSVRSSFGTWETEDRVEADKIAIALTLREAE